MVMQQLSIMFLLTLWVEIKLMTLTRDNEWLDGDKKSFLLFLK